MEKAGREDMLPRLINLSINGLVLTDDMCTWCKKGGTVYSTTTQLVFTLVQLDKVTAYNILFICSDSDAIMIKCPSTIALKYSSKRGRGCILIDTIKTIFFNILQQKKKTLPTKYG